MASGDLDPEGGTPASRAHLMNTARSHVGVDLSEVVSALRIGNSHFWSLKEKCLTG